MKKWWRIELDSIFLSLHFWSPHSPTYLNTLVCHLSCCFDKAPDKCNLRRYWGSQLEGQSIVAGKSWWQEWEEASLIVSPVRKQKIMLLVLCLPPAFYSRHGPREWRRPHLMVVAVVGWGVSSYFSLLGQDNFSKTCLEVCLHSDFTPSQLTISIYFHSVQQL